MVTVDEAVAADPAAAVAALHRAWASRTPVVVALAVDPGVFRAPRSYSEDDVGPTWLLDAGFTPEHDRLHFLVWANTYDARQPGEPVWWWGRKAARLGACEAPAGAGGDVVLPGGELAWVDGGPRGDSTCLTAVAAATAAGWWSTRSPSRPGTSPVPPATGPPTWRPTSRRR